jgi:protein O-GlcNAc transferase
VIVHYLKILIFPHQHCSNTIEHENIGQVQIMTKVSRNDLCPCGSGRKFKKCCGQNQPRAEQPTHFVSIEQMLHSVKQFQQVGKQQEALSVYHDLLRHCQNNADALHSLGLLSLQLGMPEEALDLMQRAVNANPQVSAFQNNLGNALNMKGRHEEAIVHYQSALQLRPDYVEAHNNLGLALNALGKTEKAIPHYKRALELRPDYAGAHNNLGLAMFKADDNSEEAIAHIRQALELMPDNFDAHNNMALVFCAQGKLDQALPHYQRSLDLRPNNIDTYISIGGAYLDLGHHDQALEYYEKALVIKPDHTTLHDNKLLTLNYMPNCDPASLYEHHRKYFRCCAESLLSTIQPHLNNRSPNRRLRIGYVSSDFRQHPVAHFIEPVLERHNHEKFEIYCYYADSREDAINRRIRSYADKWREIMGKPDEEVVRTIREDQIDILVDLGGHTGGTRLLIFARKPAPVQVTWLGYPNTTGLTTMDYRITDIYADPVGMTEAFHSEQLVRLPECFSCYSPPRNSPDVAESPFFRDGYITFGSFNNFAKVSTEVMRLWAKVLVAVPDSRLILKYRGLNGDYLQKRVVDFFASCNVPADRLELLGSDGSQFDHLARYNDIDIALDTFPYNGTTTTCDAIWMSVPVITLAGQTHVGRVGVSQMNNLGLSELIAISQEDYVLKAEKLAKNTDYLRKLRSGMRARMSASPLMNAERLTRNIEQAYRNMWLGWCQGNQKR